VESDETPNVLVDGVTDTCGFGVCGDAGELRDVIEWMSSHVHRIESDLG
jgi:hypothetical protein